MTLQELGNLGEFIGAIGVVVTLVFLAVQIRHNTQAIRDESSRDMAQHTSEFLAPIIKDAEFAQIFREGFRTGTTSMTTIAWLFHAAVFPVFFLPAPVVEASESAAQP